MMLFKKFPIVKHLCHVCLRIEAVPVLVQSSWSIYMVPSDRNPLWVIISFQCSAQERDFTLLSFLTPPRNEKNKEWNFWNAFIKKCN